MSAIRHINNTLCISLRIGMALNVLPQLVVNVKSLAVKRSLGLQLRKASSALS